MNWNEEPKTERFGSPMLPAIKQFIVFLIGWIGFKIVATSIQVAFILVARANGWNASEFLSQNSTSMIINSLCYIGLLVALVLVANTNILKLLKSFKQWQSYGAGVVALMAIFAFNITYNIFIEALKQAGIINIPISDNANQTAIVSLESQYPFTCLFVFGLIGPICEELTYRVGLFSLLKRRNRVMAYFVSIVVFAFIHFNVSTNPTTLMNEIINLPSYMFAGFAFAFAYDKFGFAGSLTAHALNNIIGIVPAIFR